MSLSLEGSHCDLLDYVQKKNLQCETLELLILSILAYNFHSHFSFSKHDLSFFLFFYSSEFHPLLSKGKGQNHHLYNFSCLLRAPNLQFTLSVLWRKLSTAKNIAFLYLDKNNAVLISFLDIILN